MLGNLIEGFKEAIIQANEKELKKDSQNKNKTNKKK